MSSRTGVYPDKLRYLKEAVSENFSMAVLERGFTSYMANQVTYLAYQSDELIAVVQDKMKHQVKLDTEFIMISSCSCGITGFCEHMAAVFFLYCRQLGYRPELFIQEWRLLSAELKQPTPVLRKPEETRNKSKRHKTSLPDDSLRQSFQANDAPSAWLEALNYNYSAALGRHNVLITDWGKWVEEDTTKLSKAWSSTLQLLFAINVQLYIEQAAEDMLDKRQKQQPLHYDYWSSSPYYNLGEHNYAIIEQSLKQLEDSDVTAYSEYLIQIGEYLHNRINRTSRLRLDWLTLYQQAWWSVLNQEDWMDAEEGRIAQSLSRVVQEIGSETPATGSRLHKVRNQLFAALIHIKMRQGLDSEAWELFESKFGNSEAEFFHSYIAIFITDQEYDRAKGWLDRVLLHIDIEDEAVIQGHMDLMAAMVEVKVYEEEEYITVLSSMMPYSLPIYEEYLTIKKYDELWIDLQIQQGFYPDSFHSSDMKGLEANCPEQMLAWYHLNVEECIASKNREAYIDAVKAMKKLRVIYKKMDKLANFADYIELVRIKFSRLRALQEEMRKGKIIS
ncbi:MAG: zinc finger domain protein [Paenibacillus sp.]|jgi:hypothetical protein|nr:zinc finger domain protein [Paenibacillus sp.]